MDLLRSNPMLSMLGLIVAWQISGHLFSPVLSILLSILHPGAVYV